MSVLEVQHLLARLYTDPRLLAEYLADREAFSIRHANGCSEFISQIDARQLEFFAVSLRCKRAGEVKKLLPMTVAALGDNFAEKFDRYAPTAIPSGERKHLADSMAFCEYLIDRAGVLDRLTLESASFELLDFTVRFNLKREGRDPVVVEAQPARRPWLRLNRFESRLSALTGADDINDERSQKRRLVLFARVPGLRGTWYW